MHLWLLIFNIDRLLSRRATVTFFLWGMQTASTHFGHLTLPFCVRYLRGTHVYRFWALVCWNDSFASLNKEAKKCSQRDGENKSEMLEIMFSWSSLPIFEGTPSDMFQDWILHGILRRPPANRIVLLTTVPPFRPVTFSQMFLKLCHGTQLN